MDNNINDNKLIETLNKKISRLRAVIYIFVAISVLLTCLVLFWTNSPYYSSLETFYSTPPQPPQASLYLSPKDGNYSVGNEFSINVLINTEASNVVVTAAYLSFNKDSMEALSVNTSNSVFDMQAEKEINNKEGKIKLTLGKPTPGVNVHNGLVATIRFKALKKVNPFAENVYFDFTKDSSIYSTIILDDKKGTNILNATRGARIFIN